MKMLDFRRMAAIVTATLLLWSFAVLADENDEVVRLYRQGNLVEALEQADAYLSRNPGDAQMRFQKGLILTEQKRIVDAIQVFSSLSKDYPNLPEPYNNLAVLYASQGEYDKAKDALEAAIRTHPSYSTAHENLGDVYAKMASQAYGKALQLDKDNAAAQTKLSMIKDLLTDRAKEAPAAHVPAPRAAASSSKGQAPATVGNASKPEKKAAVQAQKKPALERTAPPPVPREPGPEKLATGKLGEKPVAQKAMQAVQAMPPPDRAPVAKAAPEGPAATRSAAKSPEEPAADDSREIIGTIHAWAKAWSDKDVATYFGFYADDFRFSGSKTRAGWEKSRQERITKPKFIEVTVTQPKIQFIDPARAKVSFRQSYRSDAFKNETSKTLEMIKKGKKWLIKRERSGR